MEKLGVGMPALPLQGQRSRRRAVWLALLMVFQVMLPLAALIPFAPSAAASVISTTDDGRSTFQVPITGLPTIFNVSVPDQSVVTSFTVRVATAPGQSAPIVPANVTLDLGLDGTDWSFGGGEEGAVGLQVAFRGGARWVTAPVGTVATSFPFVLPMGASISAGSFDVVPRANMTLWDATQFVTEVSGAAAVPLNMTANSTVEVGDIDNDTVLDLIAMGPDGMIHIFHREGTTGLLFNETPGAVSPGLTSGRGFMAPFLTDIDNDGDLDLALGAVNGELTMFFRQNLTAGPPYDFAEDALYFQGVQVLGNASPTMGDLDGDGDLDLVVGSSTGELFHYRNEIGEGTGLSWRVLSTMLADNVSVRREASPDLADIDKDGDLDLVVGASDGSVSLFTNAGNATTPRFRFEGKFLGIAAVTRSTPEIYDWGQDGEPDLFFGNAAGTVLFCNSLGGLPANLTVSVPGSAMSYLVQAGTLASPQHVQIPPTMWWDLSNATLPLSADSWGNALEAAALEFRSDHFGQVEVSNLSISYDASFTLPDLASDYAAWAQTAAPQGNRLIVPLRMQGVPWTPATSPQVLIESIRVLIDDPPAFLPIPQADLDEDSFSQHLVDLAPYAIDENPTNLSFTLDLWTNSTYVLAEIVDGHFLSVDAAAGDLNDNWTGTVRVSVRAQDSLGQYSLAGTVNVTVGGVEDAPVVEFIPAQYLEANQSLRLTASAIDGDPLDTLRFSLLPPTPAGVTIDANSGFLYWNPSSAERGPGPARILVAATDGQLADTQTFDVYFLPAAVPVFGRALPRIEVLPGRPEFINLFDFATGNGSNVISITLSGPAHPYVNLSADGQWVALDYPAEFPAGSDRVVVQVETQRGPETVALDVDILPLSQKLQLAPFPPSPLGRGTTHRIELLRYTTQISDFRNLSYSVDNPLASISGYNLTMLVPPDYPGQSLTLNVQAAAGADSATIRWRVNLQAQGDLPRMARIAAISGGARDIDLSWALASRGVPSSNWPLTTDSAKITAVGPETFRVTFAQWALNETARDNWPIARARVLDGTGRPVLEVEAGYDGRSRYVNRIQYFQEDAGSIIDGTFVGDPVQAGTVVHDVSIIGTGPFAAGARQAITRLDGSPGTGWAVSFTKDTRLEQLSIVGISDPGGGGSTMSWGIWAVVNSVDDAPVYLGGISNITVDRGLQKTVALSQYFADEEGDPLVYTISQAAPGVSIDHATGWLTLNGSEEFNLTNVRAFASEARDDTLFAESGPFSLQVAVQASGGSNQTPDTVAGWWGEWWFPFALFGLLIVAGMGAYLVLVRRESAAEERADEAVDGLIASMDGPWRAVSEPRPAPTQPPAPDDPQMVALDEEWARVIASRHTDGSTAAEETEAELDGGPRKHGRSRPTTEPAPQPPARPVNMTSSDTETKRRAGLFDL